MKENIQTQEIMIAERYKKFNEYCGRKNMDIDKGFNKWFLKEVENEDDETEIDDNDINKII